MPAADADRHASFRHFVFRDLPGIRGYLEPQDALIISALLREQRNSRLAGCIVDIGVYFGRSYFLFRKIASPGTKVVGIDVFDSKSIGSETDQYSAFLDNGRRLGLPVDESLVLAGDSTILPAAVILQKCGKAAFVSIDGGHRLDQVKADAELASGCLADHGIVALDDTHNPLWPEVTIGVADFIRGSGGAFVIVAFSRFKSYVCRTEYRDLYRNALSNAPDLRFMEKEEVEYLGSKALFLRVPVGNRVLHAIFQRLKLASLAEFAFTRC